MEETSDDAAGMLVNCSWVCGDVQQQVLRLVVMRNAMAVNLAQVQWRRLGGRLVTAGGTPAKREIPVNNRERDTLIRERT